MRRLRLLLPAALGVLALVALAVALLLGKEGTSTPPVSPIVSVPRPPARTTTVTGGFEGATLPGTKTAPDFSLEDQYGRTVSLASLRGQPVLLTFLYSHCGGPCVLIAQQIRGALDELGESPIPVLIVSVDPRADTPRSIRSFLAQVSLSGRVHYLTGTEAQLDAAWKAYGVRPASAGAATFAKYATVRLLDSRGQERVLYGAEQLTPEALVHDIRKLAGTPATP